MKKLFNNLFKKKHLDLYYSSEEIEELTDFIETTYGPVETVAHEVESDDFHIDLAIIPPHEGFRYYTLCSIGHGAQKLNDNEEECGRQEFVLYLPENWNVMDEGFDKIENWWPIAMLKDVSRQHDYFYPSELLDYGEPFAECTQATAAFFAPSLADFYYTTGVVLSTGKEVEFVQIIPITNQEIELVDNCETGIEKIASVLDLDIDLLEQEKIASSQIAPRIIAHFERIIKAL